MSNNVVAVQRWAVTEAVVATAALDEWAPPALPPPPPPLGGGTTQETTVSRKIHNNGSNNNCCNGINGHVNNNNNNKNAVQQQVAVGGLPEGSCWDALEQVRASCCACETIVGTRSFAWCACLAGCQSDLQSLTAERACVNVCGCACSCACFSRFYFAKLSWPDMSGECVQPANCLFASCLLYLVISAFAIWFAFCLRLVCLLVSVRVCACLTLRETYPSSRARACVRIDATALWEECYKPGSLVFRRRQTRYLRSVRRASTTRTRAN